MWVQCLNIYFTDDGVQVSYCLPVVFGSNTMFYDDCQLLSVHQGFDTLDPTTLEAKWQFAICCDINKMLIHIPSQIISGGNVPI